MSDTYSLVCDGCKKKFWAGQRDYLYSIEKTSKFLHDHQGHALRFLNDLADDEKSQDYTCITYELTEVPD